MGVATFKDNVNINGDLQVNSDLHINGSIGGNLDVIGNLNVGGYIKQRTASWSLGGAAYGEINVSQIKWSHALNGLSTRHQKSIAFMNLMIVILKKGRL